MPPDDGHPPVTDLPDLTELDNVNSYYIDPGTGEIVVEVSEKKGVDKLDPDDVVPEVIEIEIDGETEKRYTRVEQVGPPEDLLDPYDFTGDDYPARRKTWDRYAAGLRVVDERGASGSASAPMRRTDDGQLGLISGRHNAPVEGSTVTQGTSGPGIAVVDETADPADMSDSGWWDVIEEPDDVPAEIENYWTDLYLGLGRCAGLATTGGPGEIYKKSGGRSGVTSMVLLSADSALDVDGETWTGILTFSNGGMKGDSCSLILRKNPPEEDIIVETNPDAEWYIVGMLFRGTIRVTKAIKIERLLELHGPFEPAVIDPPPEPAPEPAPEPEPEPEPAPEPAPDPEPDPDPVDALTCADHARGLLRCIFGG